jgi:hypothetical protein
VVVSYVAAPSDHPAATSSRGWTATWTEGSGRIVADKGGIPVNEDLSDVVDSVSWSPDGSAILVVWGKMDTGPISGPVYTNGYYHLFLSVLRP